MAPEQAQGKGVDARADVYALGCVLYHAFTGDLPFDHESDLENLWAHVHEPVPDLRTVRPDLPASLIEAVTAALAKDPDDRPSSAGEFAGAAAAALSV